MVLCKRMETAHDREAATFLKNLGIGNHSAVMWPRRGPVVDNITRLPKISSRSSQVCKPTWVAGGWVWPSEAPAENPHPRGGVQRVF
jgi:hypothetical protein